MSGWQGPTEHHICTSASSLAFGQPRGRKGQTTDEQGRRTYRPGGALGNYYAQYPGWISGETKAERSRKVLRVTGKAMAEPGLGPSSF